MCSSSQNAIIAQRLRSIVIEKAAKPYVERAWEAARTKMKPLKDLKGSRAKIRYIGGWWIATLRYSKCHEIYLNRK
jgi:hypothetical protein